MPASDAENIRTLAFELVFFLSQNIISIMSIPLPASLQSSLDATKVEYAQVGSSGLRVSSPILGTMGIGSKDWQPWAIEEEEGLQVLKSAWDRGKLTEKNVLNASNQIFSRD